MSKKNRQRDSEQTRRRLLDAVSELMRERGFTSLRTNTIARLIGRDKNLIRYHFSGLAGLEKAYIREKDYWGVFFERFQLSEGADSLEVEMLFIELMKENLRFFHSDREMQRIILWQISEENPVLRSISESRERDGAKLLDMTDPYFSGTEVNFRALIALLLGGSYYMVLHANTNKSVVCGINVNAERERMEVLRSIEQVISWAFKAVGQGNVSSGNDKAGSTYRFARLESMAGSLRKCYVEGRMAEFPMDEFGDEVCLVERDLLAGLAMLKEDSELRSFIRLNLFRLSRIADSCYLPKEKINIASGLIATLIWNMTGPFMELVPDSFVLPQVMWADALERSNEKAQEIKKLLLDGGIDQRLVSISLIPFNRFALGRENSTWGELLYLESYEGHLGIAAARPTCTEVELRNILLSLNLNTGELIGYWIEGIVKAGASVTADELIQAKKEALDLNRLLLRKFNQHGSNAVELLAARLDQELSFLLEKEQHGIRVNKLGTHLSVHQLALWQKLQYDCGIYKQQGIGGFSAQVASSFTSKSGDSLSASSIRAKLYTTDPAVTGPLEQMLLRMLAQLRGPKS